MATSGVQKALGRRGGVGKGPEACPSFMSRERAGLAHHSPGERGCSQGLQEPRPQVPSPLTEETPFEVGIRVQIHTQEEPPSIDQLGFGAAPGYQIFVSCQQQQVSLPGPSPPPPTKAPPPSFSPHHFRPQPCSSSDLSQGLNPSVTTHSPWVPASPQASLTRPSTAELPATTLGRLQLSIPRPRL